MARQTSCMSNLSSMGQVISVYTSENNGMYMNHRRGLHFNWHDHLINLGMSTEDFLCAERGATWTSHKNPEVELPVVAKTIPGKKESAHHFMPYGYNAFWFGIAPYKRNPLGRNYTLVTDVVAPDSTLIISDSRLSLMDSWASTLWYTKRVNNEWVSNIHAGESNILWVDGHVSFENAQAIDEAPELDHYWRPQ